MPSVIRQSIAGLNVRKELVNGDSESGSDLSDVTLASDDAQFAVPSISRQSIVGLKRRKKLVKEKNAQIQQVMKENDELKEAQNKHDDDIIELQFKVKELEIGEERSQIKIKHLEEELNKNTDEWFLTVFKSLTPDGRREIKTVINVI